MILGGWRRSLAQRQIRVPNPCGFQGAGLERFTLNTGLNLGEWDVPFPFNLSGNNGEGIVNPGTRG